ncbi:Stage II sporulation protein E (SpoIIE) [Amycolatopsis pretoriensis]|uniref:Stage II sporulation protein E (SpoIIE) n=1 Tax=Amycolatopsis pretoriensis TaxID=218821 RepID=A0A1H5Q248_9PSEU|nr:SpoIIE family protein phosphatase [Amycolatopsis pretoriensis]SEF20202.1 Stage II sporulation protein E (SpoIIE) [Amycolatopsis pretoriensis]
MTATVAAPTHRIRVDHPGAADAAARVARETANDAGLPDVLAERAAVVAAALAGAIDEHTRGGSVFVQRSLTGRGVDVLAAGDGPGTADLDRRLLDGTGPDEVKRLATGFRITSSPTAGTLAAARVLDPAGPPFSGSAGHFRLPREGEEYCGDAVALAEVTGSRTACVADGLGHGPDAAEAADAAMRVFTENPDRPLPHQLTNMHRALRTTRGAAVALVRVAPHRLEFCGVGNVSGATVGGASRLLLSTPGIVGFSLPAAPVRQLALAGDEAVVLHTDGVGSGWRGPGRPADVLLFAADVAHRYRDPHDDAALLALHPERPA